MKLLNVFSAIVDCQGFAGAEATLGMSQSSISVAMAKLESRLGMRLCQRGRRGFKLTESGQQFYQSMQRFLSAAEDFKAETALLSGSLTGVLHLGIIDSTISDPKSPVRAAIEKFKQRTDGDVELDIAIVDTPATLQKQVLDGRLHLGIGPFGAKMSGLTYRRLYGEDHLLCCGPGHPLFEQASDNPPIASHPDLRVAVRSDLNKDDIKAMGLRAPVITVDNVEARTFLLLSGIYIGFLPKHVAEPWIEAGELRALAPERLKQVVRFDLVVRKTFPRMPIVELFIACLLDSTAQRKRAAA